MPGPAERNMNTLKTALANNPFFNIFHQIWLNPIVCFKNNCIIYIIFYRVKNVDRDGKPISNEFKLVVISIILGIHLIFGIVAGVIIYKLTQRCESQIAWVVVAVALILPFIIFLFGLAIMEIILGVKLLFATL